MNVKAVLFDFDGTLAKTMEDNYRAWAHALAGYGVRIKPEDYYSLEGANVYEITKVLFSKYNVPAPDAKEVVAKKERHYLEHHHFSLYPGVEPLVRMLRDRKVPMAVVTAALSDRIERSAPSGFLALFDTVVTGEETAEGKPSPAPYLKAAEKLSMKPADCVVVENAPLGVRSAKQAGAYCIALLTTVGRGQLSGADEVLDSFEDLKNSTVIKELLGSGAGTQC